jgi:putative Mg2+ transporter-C (MgtC) family protein
MIEQIIGADNLSFLVSLMLAITAGIVIGAEKELRGKDAGLRTHSFVVVGSMLFTYISGLFLTDPARISAQIVTGIGFLGAGIILKGQSGHVQNLTTAASIWVSAGIGMAFGYRLYFVGIACTVVAIFLSWLPHIRPKNRHKPQVYYNEDKAARLINI